MRTHRLHYLHQKPHQKLKLKSILLTLAAVIFLSACGIKGDLYQTPEQAVTSKDKVAQSDEGQKTSVNKNAESQKQQAVQQPNEQTEQVTYQSTDQVKGQQ